MKTLIKITVFAVITATAFSCKKQTTEPSAIVSPTEPSGTQQNLVKLGETYLSGSGAKTVVYSGKDLVTGQNSIYAAVFDSIDGSALSDGHFKIEPVMDMGTMKHACPVENPTSEVPVNGYYQCAVFFSMPGNSSQWSLNLKYHNHKNGKHGNSTLGVNVANPSAVRFKSCVVEKDSNAAVMLSLLSPISPSVGINEFEIVLHRKKTMMEYPFIDNYSVEIEPGMPSMGHGSPNNVNPVHVEKGHYKGKVNFTMSGLWRIKLRLFKNGTLISEDQYFDITI